MLPSFVHQSHSMFHLILHKVSWCPCGIPITLARAELSERWCYLGQQRSVKEYDIELQIFGHYFVISSGLRTRIFVCLEYGLDHRSTH